MATSRIAEGGAAAVFGAAEGGDEQRHGDERELPEAVVEEEVEGGEDAEHRDLLEEEECVEELRAGLDCVPRGQHADGGEEGSEDDEPHAEAVDAEVIADVGGRDPGEVLLELEGARGGVVVEVAGEVEGEEQRKKRDEERTDGVALASRLLRGALALGDEGEQDRSR